MGKLRMGFDFYRNLRSLCVFSPKALVGSKQGYTLVDLSLQVATVTVAVGGRHLAVLTHMVPRPMAAYQDLECNLASACFGASAAENPLS